MKYWYETYSVSQLQIFSFLSRRTLFISTRFPAKITWYSHTIEVRFVYDTALSVAYLQRSLGEGKDFHKI